MSQDDNAPGLLSLIDAEQLRLREILSGNETSRLAERPANGNWSVVENVRHLLFAEQLHLGRFAHGGQGWSTAGLPPQSMRDKKRLRMEGSAATTVEEALAAWQVVHDSIREGIRDDTEEVRKALERNLRHLRSHIKVVERLLRVRKRDRDAGPSIR